MSDAKVPHSARVWNYWLGGKDNYAVDREAGDRYAAVFPGIIDAARASRACLGRVIGYLVQEAGIRQFLDIGTGLPTAENTHQVAQRHDPGARIVYVDNDPLVLAHARALLTSSPEGETAYLHADMHDPRAILAKAAETLDFQRPIALLMFGVLGHVADQAEARTLVRTLIAGLPSGSYLAVFDGTNTDPARAEADQRYNDTTGGVPYTTRSPEQIAEFFTGLDLVDPGLVPRAGWRPAIAGTRANDTASLGGVARKP
jgi:O-methyltransferase involved in polyketide biosynthesis